MHECLNVCASVCHAYIFEVRVPHMRLIKEHIRSSFIPSGLSCVRACLCVCVLLFVVQLSNFNIEALSFTV